MKKVEALKPGRTYAAAVTLDQLDASLERIRGGAVEWEKVDAGGREAFWTLDAYAFPAQSAGGAPFVLFDYWGADAEIPVSELYGLNDMGSALERYPSAAAAQEDTDTRERAALVAEYVSTWAVPLGEGVRDAAKATWGVGKLVIGAAVVVGGAILLSKLAGRR